jgi:hypothetical protein
MPLSFWLFAQSNAYSESISQSSGDSWYITMPLFNLTSSVGAYRTETVEYSASSCPLGSTTYDNLYTGFAVVDSFGTVHPINPTSGPWVQVKLGLGRCLVKLDPLEA